MFWHQFLHILKNLVFLHMFCILHLNKDVDFFGTTEEFLRSFGVSSKDELPDISPVRIEDFRAEAENEAGIKVGV